MNTKFNEMTYDQLLKYEFPRNHVKEHVLQTIERHPISFISSFIVVGIPIFGICLIKELFVSNCNECGQKKTRHLAGWDGAKTACGNPLCQEKPII